jgi:hypothetical protein
MAKRPADEAIDQLYRLDLAAFTAARNGLAQETGDVAIRKLEKPSVAAWAVNQLYWLERNLYDEVITTSIQVRTAHKNMLAGTSADTRAAEVFHAEAMRRAKDAIRRLLAANGHNASDAIMTPVTETLDALPTTDAPGRLSKALRRTGFEALQGVTIAVTPLVRTTAGGTAGSSPVEETRSGAVTRERRMRPRWRKSVCVLRTPRRAKLKRRSAERSGRSIARPIRANGSRPSSQRRSWRRANRRTPRPGPNASASRRRLSLV